MKCFNFNSNNSIAKYLLGGLCILFLLCSCENFLNGGQLKKELEADIAYAKSESVEIRVECDAAFGTIMSLPVLNKKVTDEFTVEFKINDGIKFSQWKVYYENEGNLIEQDTNKFIEIINYNETSTDGSYKATLRFVKSVEKIVIKPDCKVLPRMESITPAYESSGCDQDTMIKFTFNKEINLENFGNFKCISIYCEQDDLWNFFNSPFLSNDKKILCIQPKQDKHIISPDETSTPVIHIKYDFTDIKDNDGLELTQKGIYDYRINSKFNGQKKVEIEFLSEDKICSFISGTSKAFTVGYDVEVQFKVNLEDYKFMNLEAVSLKDQSQSYSCYISEFKPIEQNDETGVYKYSFKITSELEDKSDKILIKPVCLEYPKVESFSPSDAQLYSANTPITVIFNTPMEETVINEIKITSQGEDKSSLFETPVFDSNRKMLTIKPNNSEIMDFIGTSGGVTISVSFPSSIKVNINGTILPLKQNEKSSFEVRYKAITDIDPPVYVPESFYVTRPPIGQVTNGTTAERFNEDILLMNDEYYDKYGRTGNWWEDITAFYNQKDKIIQNRMGESVYLYGQFTDTNSGIRKITVYETYHGNNSLEYEENPSVATDYYKNSSGVIKFITDSNGVTTFCINHKLKSEDGAVSLQAAAIDVCGNETFSPVVIGFKRTHTVFEKKENFQLHNSIVKYNYTNYSEEMLSKELKTLVLEANYEDSNGDPCGDVLYSLISLPASINTITCTYKNSKGVFTTDTFKKSIENDENDWVWNLELDVDQVNGLTFNIKIEDDTGNIIEKEYTIPSLENFTYIEEYKTEESWGAYYENHVQFFYSTGEETCNRCFQIIDSNGNKNIGDYDDDYGLESNYIYYPLPCYLVERFDSYPTIYFYSESPQNVTLKKEDVLQDKQEFDLENYEDIEKPYKITNTSTEDRSIVSIKIPNLLWEKNCDSGYILLKEKGILPPKEGYKEPQFGNKYFLFDEETNEFSFEVRTQDLFASNTQILLCGTVNCIVKFEKEFSIPKLDKTADKELDNKLPEFTKERINPDEYTITISDIESGPDYAYFIERANIYEQFKTNVNAASIFATLDNYTKYSTDYNHAFKVDIPAWMFEEGLSYYVLDKQGNLYCGNQQASKTSIHWTTSKIQKSSNSTLKVTCTKKTNGFGEKREFIYVYKYKKVENAGEWILITKKELDPPFSNSKTITLDYSDFNSTELSGNDYFVKIISSHNQQLYKDENGQDIYEERDFSSPYIAYLDCSAFDITPTTYDSSFDLILPNGGLSESVAISSKSPVFVQTAVTWQPYEECKDWSADEWIYNRYIVNEQQLNFDNSTTLMRYGIPMEKIKTGQCYCIIAHFADGHTENSQVMKK